MIFTSFFFLALRLTLYVVSQILGDESSQLISPLQKARSIFVSLDAMIDVIIFFKHFFRVPQPTRQKSELRGARLFQSNIAQRQSSLADDSDDSINLGGSPFSTNRHRLGSELSEVKTESQNENNSASNSLIAKVKTPFHRKGSMESNADNEPTGSSLGSIDENHPSIIAKVKASFHRNESLESDADNRLRAVQNEENKPSNSIIANVKGLFHRKGSMDSDFDNNPMLSSLGPIDEENNSEELHQHSSIVAKVKASFHRKGSMESDTDNGPGEVKPNHSNPNSFVEKKLSSEDLHPVRIHVMNGNEMMDLPKWVVREYATNVTECNSLLYSLTEEA